MSGWNRRDVFAGLAAGLAAAGTNANAAQPMPSWSSRASLPWSVQEVYATVWRGRIVVAGGLAVAGREFRVFDRTGIYDPIADHWEEGPRLPAPRHHPMLVASDDGKVYAFGGFNQTPAGDWTARTEVWVFDSQSWRAAPPLPAPQCETVGANLGGRIHLVTGRAPRGAANGNWPDQGDIATHRVFDPAGGRWTDARPAPAPRNSAAGAVIGGMLYVVGGRTVMSGNTARLDRYDPGADRWDTLRPMPQAQGGLAAATASGKLIAFGGEFPGVFKECWVYDPTRDTWAAGPDMRTPRHGLAGASIGETAYAIAGAIREGADGASGVFEALTGIT
jgi:N-acetylneuraminic acid mutarotase